jgi:hypothetical protein
MFGRVLKKLAWQHNAGAAMRHANASCETGGTKMRTIIITAGLALAAVSGASAATPPMTCKLQNGAPCTAQHVQNLQNRLKQAGTGSRAVLADVKTLSVAPNGALTCEQANGKACTSQQIKLILEVSANTDLTIAAR